MVFSPISRLIVFGSLVLVSCLASHVSCPKGRVNACGERVNALDGLTSNCLSVVSRLTSFNRLSSNVPFRTFEACYRTQSDWKSLLHTLPARERDARDAKGTQRSRGRRGRRGRRACVVGSVITLPLVVSLVIALSFRSNKETAKR